MQTRRDRILLVLLMVQAALGFINSSAYSAQLFPDHVRSAIGLIAGTLSVVTGVYVARTRENEPLPGRGITSGVDQE